MRVGSAVVVGQCDDNEVVRPILWHSTLSLVCCIVGQGSTMPDLAYRPLHTGPMAAAQSRNMQHILHGVVLTKKKRGGL